ncbi:Asp23/Gls24 family envelope stress response protein [Pseudokineococcus marinus]|uniref:Asp23/Gls24 family envelope stress response protein n=1 Tax=Pseudokineococcus marinus TaxID=351215 RepID=A0A849BT51_9ACTN|nr:Asp23/Gls24 family envelope stress response protein [Pseudokineococcus marinus]NNH23634.1 Asp23/Gls24 family envelope stress response protein [Pseudokineococcus marinus]
MSEHDPAAGGRAGGGPGADVEPDLDRDAQPCGTPTDALLDVASGEPAPPDLADHAGTCVHCRAVLSRAEELWEPVRQMARQEEPPPPDLVASVMAAVRRLGREPLHLVLPDERGTTRVSAAVIARIAEEAARRAVGVAAVLARDTRAELVGEPEGGAEGGAGAVGVADRLVVVALAVVTDLSRPIPAVADDVRARVARELVGLTGRGGAQVDIYVHDVVVA